MTQVMRNTQRTPALFSELGSCFDVISLKATKILQIFRKNTFHISLSRKHFLKGMRELTTARPLSNRTLFIHKCWYNRKKSWKAAWRIVYSMPINILRKTKKSNWCMHIINAVCLRFLARPGRQNSADHTCRKTNWAHF